MDKRHQNSIRRIYVCRSEQIEMAVFVFLENGDRPRAIARIQQQTGSNIFVEFPSLPLQPLQQRVEENVRSFSKEFGGEVMSLQWPEGCSPRELLIAMHHKGDGVDEPQTVIH